MPFPRMALLRATQIIKKEGLNVIPIQKVSPCPTYAANNCILYALGLNVMPSFP